jgi:Nuclease-related domain
MSTGNQLHHIQKLALEQEYWTHRFQFLSRAFIVLSVVGAIVVPFQFKLPGALLLLACARLFFLLAKETIRRRERLEASLAAEKEVHNMLVERLPSGWLVEANVEIPRFGDIDLFVTSPKRSCFAIEIKSHQGEVLFDGKCLRRGSGKCFEKDFLTQVMRAAMELRKMRNLPFVNALLVFTRAKLSLSERHIRQVQVLSSEELVNFLLSQESSTGSKSAGISTANVNHSG